MQLGCDSGIAGMLLLQFLLMLPLTVSELAVPDLLDEQCDADGSEDRLGSGVIDTTVLIQSARQFNVSNAMPAAIPLRKEATAR